MDHCPFFLKRLKSPVEGKRGITIVEMMIVVAFLAILGVILLVALKPQTQLAKARDARRKTDLQKLKNILEDYYNDKSSYPDSLNCGGSLTPYLDKIPCDSATGQSYGYVKSATSYRLYAKLEYDKDSTIVQVGCQNGCGPGGSCDYNYGVSSANVGLEPCLGCTGLIWGCDPAGICNATDLSKWDCPKTFCNDSNCGGVCDDSSNWCTLK